jgi:hypothetical protein
MNLFAYTLILNALRATKNRRIYSASGICGNTRNYLEIEGYSECEIDQLMSNMTIVATHWSKFSGCDLYPVPNPNSGRSVNITDDAAELYWRTHNKWKGDYGVLRMELLDYLIDYYNHRVNP